MLTTRLLIIISRTDSTGIPKTSLRTEYRVLHGQVGQGEFDEGLRDLALKKLIRIGKDAISDDPRIFITAKGGKAL